MAMSGNTANKQIYEARQNQETRKIYHFKRKERMDVSTKNINQKKVESNYNKQIRK